MEHGIANCKHFTTLCVDQKARWLQMESFHFKHAFLLRNETSRESIHTVQYLSQNNKKKIKGTNRFTTITSTTLLALLNLLRKFQDIPQIFMIDMFLFWLTYSLIRTSDCWKIRWRNNCTYFVLRFLTIHSGDIVGVLVTKMALANMANANILTTIKAKFKNWRGNSGIRELIKVD